jgi:hypothetical protein
MRQFGSSARARRGVAILAALATLAGLIMDSPAIAGPQAVARGATAALPSVRSGLPLGPAGLPETRTVERLAPGVTLTTIERGQTSPADVWTVTAGFFPDPRRG